MQISDAPSQIREALFSLNCCFKSKCIISYQPDIEDFKTTDVKYYCPYKAIFEFGIPLVNLLHTANSLTVQKVSIQGQIIESRKFLKEWCRDYGTNKKNNLTLYVKGVRLFGILHLLLKMHVLDQSGIHN